mgnify:FL=1
MGLGPGLGLPAIPPVINPELVARVIVQELLQRKGVIQDHGKYLGLTVILWEVVFVQVGDVKGAPIRAAHVIVQHRSQLQNINVANPLFNGLKG